MQVRYGALVAVLLAGPVAGIAAASGTEVTGLGFRGRAPAGFRAGEKKEGSDACVRTFHLNVPGAGEVTLTFASHTQEDAEIAKTEMALSRGLDVVEAKMELPDSEPQVTDARVPGAEEAYEVVAQGGEGSWRTLSARAGALFVNVTLAAPVGAEEEIEEAWSLATASLRVEEPSLQVGTIILWVLGFLALVAVLVRLAKGRAAAPFTPAHPAAPAPPSPAAFEPSPVAALPSRPAPAHGLSSSFSRADDGLPVFSHAEKAAGASGGPTHEKLRPAAGGHGPSAPPPLPRAHTPPPPPPAPPRPPNLAPSKPVVRIVKGYSGAPTSP